MREYELFFTAINHPFDPDLVLAEILNDFGYQVMIEEFRDIDGNLTDGAVRVLVDKEEIDKVKEIAGLFKKTPDSRLFQHTFLGSFPEIEVALADNDKQGVNGLNSEWISQNKELVSRALARSYLQHAQINEYRLEQYHLPESFRLIPVIYRVRAETVSELPLDPEGLQLVIYQKLEEILEQYPALRPE